MPGKGGRNTLALVMQNIVDVLYIYADAVKQLIIHTKRSQTLALWSPGLPDLKFHCPYIICMVMFIDISPTLSTSLKKKKKES